MTVVLAILLALGVPFAQLRTVDDRVTCCCPSPEQCKCPDHKPDKSADSTMRACHKQAPDMVSTQLDVFVELAFAVIVAPAQPTVRIAHMLPRPHAPPVPERPDAPSWSATES